jgi:hypothetical protein
VTDERTFIAIGRLDRALARLEAAAARALAAEAADAGKQERPDDRPNQHDAELTALRAAHQQLRARTEDAVAALDRLIGRG